MAELHLDNSIISFDGKILEAFRTGQPSQRYRVEHIDKAEIQSDRKGRQAMLITAGPGTGIMTPELTGERLAQAQALVSEIQQARGG